MVKYSGQKSYVSSVKLAQKKLLEIFSKRIETYFVTFSTSINFLLSIKIENETSAETGVENVKVVEIESGSLAAEIEQIDFACSDFYSDNLLAPQIDVNPLSLAKLNQSATVVNPLESIDSYETETNEFGERLHKCVVCSRRF